MTPDAPDIAALQRAQADLAEREAVIERLRKLVLRAQEQGQLPHTRDCGWQHSEKREAAALAEDCNCGVATSLAEAPPRAALEAYVAERLAEAHALLKRCAPFAVQAHARVAQSLANARELPGNAIAISHTKTLEPLVSELSQMLADLCAAGFAPEEE